MNNYTCPNCKTTHSSYEWDATTSEAYDDGYTTSIHDEDSRNECMFNCPNCKIAISYIDLLK